MDDKQIESRLDGIEARLSKIEKALSLSVSAPRSSAPVVSSVPAPAVPKETFAELPLSSTSRASGTSWLGIISLLCFVLAASFIIKLSIDSGWLTPLRQLGIASLLGLVLIYLGLKFEKLDRSYAAYLPAAGIIILYLVAFGACAFYRLFSYEAGLGITFAISSLCLALHFRLRNEYYIYLAALGAYFGPALVGFNTQNTFTLVYYFICSLFFSMASFWMKTRVLLILSSYLAIIVTLRTGLASADYINVATSFMLQLFVFLVGHGIISRKTGQLLTEGEVKSLMPAAGIFYASEYYFINAAFHASAPWLFLALSALMFLGYVAVKRGISGVFYSQGLIFGFVSVALVHCGYIKLLPTAYEPWLAFVLLLGGAFLPVPNKEGDKATKAALVFPFLAIFFVLGREYFAVLFHLLQKTTPENMLVALAFYGGFWLLLLKPKTMIAKNQERTRFLLSVMHILAIITLYRATYGQGALVLSASWLFYALGVIAVGFSIKDKDIARSALLILGLASAKALIFDAAAASMVIRIFCLLLTGAVLYGCGHLIRRVDLWEKKELSSGL